LRERPEMGTVRSVGSSAVLDEDITDPEVREKIRAEALREAEKELRERVVSVERLRREQALASA
jgi:hypothetical protein